MKYIEKNGKIIIQREPEKTKTGKLATSLNTKKYKIKIFRSDNENED